MIANGWRTALALVLGLSVAQGSANAGDHHHGKACDLPCHIWKLCEVEETVYEVKYKKVKKKVMRPVVREIKKEIHNPVCIPRYWYDLKECLVPDWKREVKNIETCTTKTCTDECGCKQSYTETATELMTCMVKCMTPIVVPTLQWTMVREDRPYNETYLVREMKEVEIEIEVPVKTPKVVVKKIWKKVPVTPCKECKCSKCGAENDCACDAAAGPALESVPVEGEVIMNQAPAK